MGDMSEYYRDLEDDREDEEQAILHRLLKRGLWPGKDKHHKIIDMTPHHLRSCIRLIKENSGWRDMYLEPLQDRLKFICEDRWVTHDTPFKRIKT